MKLLKKIVLLIGLMGLLNRSGAQDSLAAAVPAVCTDSVVVASVVISGNTKTRDYIILRELAFGTGSWLPAAAVDKALITARQQLINTSLFVAVEVAAVNLDSTTILVNVAVKERWYLLPIPYFKLVDRNFNQWWVEQHHSLRRVNYGLKLIQNNVSGRNDNAYLWLVTGYNHQLAFRYEQPYADKALKSGFSTAVSFARQREVNYATSYNNKQLFYRDAAFIRQQFRIEAAYLYRPRINTRHRFTLRLVDERIADTVWRLNRNYYPAGRRRLTYPVLSYGLQYFHTDNYVYPLRGFAGDVEITRKGLGKYMNLWQLKFHGRQTWPLAGKLGLQVQAAGFVNLPFKQPFINGQIVNYQGDIFLRGLEYYVIDGVAGSVGRATLRQQVFTHKVHNLVPVKNHEEIPVRVYAKLYGDAGYVYNNHRFVNNLNNRLLYTWGAGLDIVTIYDVVLRLEYSFNPLGGRGLYLHSRSDF